MPSTKTLEGDLNNNIQNKTVIHLHLTTRLAVLDVVPALLVAVHRYSPASM